MNVVWLSCHEAQRTVIELLFNIFQAILAARRREGTDRDLSRRRRKEGKTDKGVAIECIPRCDWRDQGLGDGWGFAATESAQPELKTMHLLTSVPLPLHPSPHTYTRGARNDLDMDDDSSAGNNSRRQPSAVSSLKAVLWTLAQLVVQQTDHSLPSARSAVHAKFDVIEIALVPTAELPI